MKKLFVLAVAMLISSVAFAAAGITRYTGIASFENSGEALFSFQLKNVSNNQSADQIEWTSPTAFNTTATDRWVRADQYAVVAATFTKAGVNVYMYQTNGNSTEYKAVEPRVNGDGTKPISGLVRKGSNGGASRGYVPLAYSFVPTKNASITFDGTEGLPTDDRANRFFVDSGDKKADGSANFNKNYALIASTCGPVFGPFDANGNLAPWCSQTATDNTAYMYFFGNFHDIVGGDIFGTDQIVIEQVGE